ELHAALVRSQHQRTQPPILVERAAVPVQDLPPQWTSCTRIDGSRGADATRDDLLRALELGVPGPVLLSATPAAPSTPVSMPPIVALPPPSPPQPSFTRLTPLRGMLAGAILIAAIGAVLSGEYAGVIWCAILLSAVGAGLGGDFVG